MLFVCHGATPWQKECAICHPQLVWNIHGNMDGITIIDGSDGKPHRLDNFFAQHSSDCILASLAFKLKKKTFTEQSPKSRKPMFYLCSTYVLLIFDLF
jgi:hypothetical protein